MSLDVSLYSKEKKRVICNCCFREYKERELLYTANITHNLGEMASEVGIYKAIWRPKEIGAKYGKDITSVVEKGLLDLKSRPEYFKKYQPGSLSVLE